MRYPSQRSRRVSSVLAVAVILVLHGIADGFPSTRIPGTFEFSFGSVDCPKKATINRQAELIVTSVPCVDNRTALTIYDDNDRVGNQLTQELKGGVEAEQDSVDRRFGRFTLAELNREMNCVSGTLGRNFTMPQGSYINFFIPEQTVVLDFVEIFKRRPPKDPNTVGAGDSHGSQAHAIIAAVRDTNIRPAPSNTGSNSSTGTGCGAGSVACNTANSTNHGGPGEKAKAIGLRKPPQLFRGRPYMSLGSECMYIQTKQAECFPASAKVNVARRGTIRMDELRTGDNVLIGKHKHSSVFMWTHRDPKARSLFVRAHTPRGALTVTPGHYVYANDALVPAARLKRGDFLRSADGKRAPVVRIEYVQEFGLYNPQTVAGDIVVDGFQVSTYTDFAQPPIAHALLAPLRLANILSPAWLVDKWRESGLAMA